MNHPDCGKLILESVPVDAKKQAIIRLLAQLFKQSTQEHLTKLVDRTPVVLNRNLPFKIGSKVSHRLNQLGAKATFEPAAPPSPPPPANPADLTTKLHAAFTGDMPRRKPSLFYHLGLIMVALAMVTLPLIYAALIGAIGWGLYAHITINHTVFTSGYNVKGAVLVYVAPIVIGVLVLLFLIKPFFARRVHTGNPHRIDRRREPALYDFVAKLARVIGAPVPTEIHVDMDVNAGAQFKSGLRDIWRKELILTIGLPLAAGMKVEQFAGVLAHELGHFAQSAGMGLTYIIRSVNFWFERVVYEEDHWDERLRHYSTQWGLRLALILWIARSGIWLSRRFLWILMRLGHLISCFMLRQMEFDADRVETWIAGSRNFGRTEKAMYALSLARYWAMENLRGAWDDGRLPDDFPALVMANLNKIPADELARDYRGILREARTRWLDTHPATTDRIARANALAQDGLFQPALIQADKSMGPLYAQCLFRDFVDFSRQVTLDFYRRLIGRQITARQLIQTGSIAQSQDNEAHFANALDRFFMRQLHAGRPLKLDWRQLKNTSQVKNAILALDQVRRAIQTGAAARSKQLTRLNTLRSRRYKLDQAIVLLKAGQTVKPAEYNLSTGDWRGVANAEKAIAASGAQVHAELADFERYMRVRMIAALGLMHLPAMGQRLPDAHLMRADARRLVTLIAAVEKAAPQLDGLQATLARLGALANRQIEDNAGDGLATAFGEHCRQVRTTLQILQTQLKPVSYPFAHSTSDLKLGDYLVAGLPAETETEAIWNAANETIEKYYQVYQRLVGRLALLLEQVETAAGKPPLTGDAPRVAWAQVRDAVTGKTP